jgi:hypothetical protein
MPRLVMLPNTSMTDEHMARSTRPSLPHGDRDLTAVDCGG